MTKIIFDRKDERTDRLDLLPGQNMRALEYTL